MGALSSDQIRNQSINAYKQWGPQWARHAKYHSKWAMKPLSDFDNIGVGRAVVAAANGYSLELEMETLKKHHQNVDIICCDKSLGHLLRNGIKPTYCLVCDANVSYEKYLKPYEDQLQDTILFINVCANPEWTDHGNWKDVYFFACMDVMNYEKEFMALSGCPNSVAAGTNVSNALVVFLTQSDNRGRRNFFGYDKILLVGFDYCWRPEGKYYAYDQLGGGKFHYMRHIYARNINNDLVYTSTNLGFSAKWLENYIGHFKLPVIQCSKESCLPTKQMGELASHMQYSFRPEDQPVVQEVVRERMNLLRRVREIETQVLEIGRAHYYAVIASL